MSTKCSRPQVTLKVVISSHAWIEHLCSAGNLLLGNFIWKTINFDQFPPHFGQLSERQLFQFQFSRLHWFQFLFQFYDNFIQEQVTNLLQKRLLFSGSSVKLWRWLSSEITGIIFFCVERNSQFTSSVFYRLSTHLEYFSTFNCSSHSTWNVYLQLQSSMTQKLMRQVWGWMMQSIKFWVSGHLFRIIWWVSSGLGLSDGCTWKLFYLKREHKVQASWRLMKFKRWAGEEYILC